MNKSEDLSYAPEFYYHGLYIGRLEYIKDDEDDPDSKGKWIVWAGQRDTEADLDYYEPTAKTTIAAFRDEVEGYGYMFGTDYDHEDVESQMDNYDPNAGFEIWWGNSCHDGGSNHPPVHELEREVIHPSWARETWQVFSKGGDAMWRTE